MARSTEQQITQLKTAIDALETFKIKPIYHRLLSFGTIAA
jgi:hypothetical protein